MLPKPNQSISSTELAITMRSRLDRFYFATNLRPLPPLQLLFLTSHCQVDDNVPYHRRCFLHVVSELSATARCRIGDRFVMKTSQRSPGN